MRTLVGTLGELLAPQRCCGCARPTQMTQHPLGLCSSCAATLGKMPIPERAAYPDVGPVAKLVRLAKRGGVRPSVVTACADVILERAGIVSWRPDLVTWVPADRWRTINRRGFSLPSELARAMAARLGVPHEALLRRAEQSVQMRGRTRAERAVLATNLFHAHPYRGTGTGTQRVLVVDDVSTSGATLAAACGALEEAGFVSAGVAFAARPLG